MDGDNPPCKQKIYALRGRVIALALTAREERWTIDTDLILD